MGRAPRWFELERHQLVKFLFLDFSGANHNLFLFQARRICWKFMWTTFMHKFWGYRRASALYFQIGRGRFFKIQLVRQITCKFFGFLEDTLYFGDAIFPFTSALLAFRSSLFINSYYCVKRFFIQNDFCLIYAILGLLFIFHFLAYFFNSGF